MPNKNDLKIIRMSSSYHMEKLAKNRHRLSKIIKEYDNFDEMLADVNKLHNGEITEDELYGTWDLKIQ